MLSYPVREWADMVWVYMGPREHMPELPQLELGLVPAAHRYVSKKWQDCNWVQSLEGAIDTSHFSFLHKVLATDDEAVELPGSGAAALGLNRASRAFLASCWVEMRSVKPVCFRSLMRRASMSLIVYGCA